MKAVVILGAGAAAPFGVPTLQRLFQDHYARAQLKKDPFLHMKLQDLFWGPRGFNLDTSHLSLTVEEILTIVRDSDQQDYKAPPLLGTEADHFRKSLYVLIKRAVYDGKSSDGRCLNPLIEFARKNFKQTTWASFNWDCIFEASFYYSSCPDPRGRYNPQVVIDLHNWHNSYGNHLFLKLHGGVNWWFEDGNIVYLPWGAQPDLDSRWQGYEQGKVGGHPVILEPSFYKYEDAVFALLIPQWQRFVESLLGADIVVIVGYSLPEADVETRRALTIGFQGNTTARYVVINSSEWACNRYTRILGRARLRCEQATIEDASGRLGELLLS